MRSVLIAITALVFTTVSAFAEFEKGKVRIYFDYGLLYITSTNKIFDDLFDGGWGALPIKKLFGGDLGVLASRNVEIFANGGAERTPRTTIGVVGGGLIIHFIPAKSVVPGLGFGVNRTFGDIEYTNIDVFFNTDMMVTGSS